MSREKQIELLEKQLAFWKHHSTVLSNELTKAEETSKRYAELLDKTEEELNAERVRSEWISVDERLPEKDVRVLVFIKSSRSYTRFDTDRLDDRGFVRWFNDVTHWMPLPEAPKMKGGAE